MESSLSSSAPYGAPVVDEPPGSLHVVVNVPNVSDGISHAHDSAVSSRTRLPSAMPMDSSHQEPDAEPQTVPS